MDNNTTPEETGALSLYEFRIGRNWGPTHPNAGEPMPASSWDAFIAATVGAALTLGQLLTSKALDAGDTAPTTSWVEVHTTNRGHYAGAVEESAVVTLYHSKDLGGHAAAAMQRYAGTLAARFVQDTVAVVVEGLGVLVPATADDPDAVSQWLTLGVLWNMHS